MAKKKKEQEPVQEQQAPKIITVNEKNTHGDIIRSTRWTQESDGSWISDRTGTLSDDALKETLKRMRENRSDVEIIES